MPDVIKELCRICIFNEMVLSVFFQLSMFRVPAGVIRLRLLVLCLFLLSGCTGIPKGIDPVTGFDLQKYYGKWYEVARLDHRFERGLQNVTAEYSALDNGFVQVKNRGFSVEKQQWSEAIGRARFKSDPEAGHLLVSFFGPFYASYVIFELDDYQQAYVVGNNRKFLWFLSRKPVVSDADKEKFLQKTRESGFDTSELIWVEQSK